MQELAVWFRSEVQSWRTAASIVWTLFLTVPTTFIFAAFARVDLLKPLTCPIDLIWLIASLSSWGYLSLLLCVIGMVAAVNAKHYSVRPNILCSRWSVIWSFVHPARLVRAVGHSVAAGLTTWCFIALVGGRYRGLSKRCNHGNTEEETSCLNEHHVFVLLHGVFTGLLVALSFFSKHHTYLYFPLVQQSKFFQVKTALLPNLLTSAADVFRQIKYFYLLYYLLLGSLFKTWILRHWKAAEEDVAINSLAGLLDLALFYHTWLVGILVHYLFSLSALLYRVYQTEPYEFSISSALEEFKNKQLQNALTCTSSPLIQYLAYQDLWLLSKHSPTRRKQIFSLTHLGGHPYHWNNLSSSCLATLQEFTSKVKDFNTGSVGGGPIRQLSGDSGLGTLQKGVGLANHTGGFPDASITSPMSTPVSTLTHRGAALVDDRVDQSSTSRTQQYGAATPKTGFKHKLIEQLKKRRAVAMFIADLPDTASRRLFAKAQKYIWAAEALTYLVISSYTEDSYGVVQKTLPDILATLFNLQEAVEKHFKLATNISRKVNKDGSQGNDAALRFALKASLKTSLYRIVAVFDKHLSAIPLSAEHSRRLKMFIDYKE